MEKLFGTDGIRARANRFPLDAETAAKIGRAVACLCMENGKTVYIGQDTRISGDMLASAVAAGACSAGKNVCQFGVLPTPAIALLARLDSAAAGIVISASHNPYSDNGIKIFQPNGFKITCAQEAAIENMMAQDGPLPVSNPGRIFHKSNGNRRYHDFLIQNSGMRLDNVDLVIDCANGATSQIAPSLFAGLGARVKVINAEPDGKNINAACGSEHPEQLCAAVVSMKASMGFAFDGDGDRIIAVDDRGQVLTGDQMLAILAGHYLKQGKLSSGTAVVSTIMSNLGLKESLERMGLEHKTCPVGDRNVAETMLASGAVLGGETSGHLICRDAHTTGDGLLAGLRLLQAVIHSRMNLSQLHAKSISLYPQKLINVEIKSKPDLDSLPGFVETVSRVEKRLGKRGRVLVRYSGTENLCRVMVEAFEPDLAEASCLEIAEVVRKLIG